MTPAGVLWALGGYVVGTLPSTWLVSSALGARQVIAASRRDAGEADAHLVVSERLGGGWAALAAGADVAKGLVWALLARHAGGLDAGWTAMAATAVVAGHAFPFYLREMAGRGLAAAAGVFLALVPLAMVVAGLTMCVGFALRSSGLFSTIGFGSVAAVAALQGQPWAFVAMSVAVFALILIRRLEGAAAVAARTGTSRLRAAFYRAVFDSSGRPGAPAPSADPGREERPA